MPRSTASRAVVIDVDSLRPDHVGAYGHPFPTTPEIDRVAADGTTFSNAYAANTPCMPSRAGLVTGRFGVHNGVETHGPAGQRVESPDAWPIEERLDADRRNWRTLPEACFHDRIPSIAVSSFPRHPAPWFHRTWNELHQPPEPPGDRETFATVRAEDVVDVARAAVGEREEFFLYCQFWEPHVPYNSTENPEQFRGVVDRHPHPTEAAIERHRNRALETPHGAADRGIADRSDLDRTLAAYDAQVRAVDRQVGRLLEWLRETDRYEDALVVVTADHGEAFGERGVYQHHWSVHEPTQRVPLVVKPPGGASGETTDALVANVDVAPTVLDYLGVERPAAWQGHTLREPVEDGTGGREALVLDHGLLTVQRAIRSGRWKLVRTLDRGGWPDLPEQALYDLEAAPHERDDRSEDCPEVVRRLSGRMEGWLATHRCGESAPLEAVADEGPPGYRFWKQWAPEE